MYPVYQFRPVMNKNIESIPDLLRTACEHLDNLRAAGATPLWGIPALPTDDPPPGASEGDGCPRPPRATDHGPRPDVPLDDWRGSTRSARPSADTEVSTLRLTGRAACNAGLRCTPEGTSAEMPPGTELHGSRNALWGKVGVASYGKRCARGRDSYRSSASQALRRLTVFLSLPMNAGES